MLLKPDSEFFRFFVDRRASRAKGASARRHAARDIAPPASTPGEVAGGRHHHGTGQAKMAQFIVAIGLVL